MPVDPDDPEVPVTDEWRETMKKAREERGWKQSELAAKVGATQNMISLLETGKQGGGSKVLAICRVLKIEPPFVPVSGPLEWRWIQAGKMLLSLNPDTLDGLLVAAEAFVETSKPKKKVAAPAPTAATSKNR